MYWASRSELEGWSGSHFTIMKDISITCRNISKHVGVITWMLYTVHHKKSNTYSHKPTEWKIENPTSASKSGAKFQHFEEQPVCDVIILFSYSVM